jgi:hypothetical protein
VAGLFLLNYQRLHKCSRWQKGDSLQIAWETGLKQPTKQILETFNIMSIMSGPTRRAYESTDLKTWHDTILITATKSSPTDNNWYLACQKLRQLFISKGYSSLNVEIIDSRASEPIYSFPIRFDEPFVQIWSKLRPKVPKTLKDGDWASLSVLHRGKKEGDKPITTAITVKEDSIYDWEAIARELENLLDAEQLLQVAIEILRGSIFQLSFEDRVLEERDFQIQAKFGGGLGPHGSSSSSSTLGSFLELEFPDDLIKTFGVTNYHHVLGNQVSKRWERKCFGMAFL